MTIAWIPHYNVHLDLDDDLSVVIFCREHLICTLCLLHDWQIRPLQEQLCPKCDSLSTIFPEELCEPTRLPCRQEPPPLPKRKAKRPHYKKHISPLPKIEEAEEEEDSQEETPLCKKTRPTFLVKLNGLFPWRLSTPSRSFRFSK